MLGARIVWVQPATWKKHLGLIGCDKSASIEMARELFPSLADQLKTKSSDGRAEALLIGWWGAQTIK